MVLVDDHEVFSELLGEALTAAGLPVLARFSTLEKALAQVQQLHPAVVVLDHRLPTGTGAGAVATLKRLVPGVRVLMLTAADEHGVLQEAMDAGCDGFLTKRQSVAAVIDAVQAVLRGETPISPDIAGALVGRRARSVGADLTRRETEILQLIGAGRGTQDIAEDLRISVNTVRNHVQRVLAKLGCHSKLEAVAVAARHGLLRTDRGTE